ncbi:MAG: NFACT RNA binding domain-containing protein [Clostridia bacterium]|nr:NFACT RNA binding domain-containing protein [Clostridia bacterium]
MSYDGVVTCAMVQELRDNLISGKIEKIYQPQPDQLLLQLHTLAGKRRLFVSASGSHSAVYLVDESPENPVNPPLFCMVLRKHLGAARITDIQQHESDRIIEILLETVDELGFNVNRKLILEIMGKHSNVLLIDMQTGKIIDSIKHVGIDVNRARQILPGKMYEYPPAQPKTPFYRVSEEYVESLTANQLQPERSLLDGIGGISPALAESMAASDRPFEWLENLKASIADGITVPRVYVRDGKPADFHVVPLAAYEEDESYEAITFDTLSKAAAFYFVNRESSNTIKQKSGDLHRVVKAQMDKLNLKVQRLNEDLHKAENSEKYRLYGELLTANLHLVKAGMKSVHVTSYYDGSDVEIPLDPRFSPAKNAQNYYKKYGKFKTAVKEKQLQLEETALELDYLESVSSFIDRAKTIEEIDLLRSELTDSGYLRFRKHPNRNRPGKKDKPKPHSYTLPSGKNVLVGRNNKENDWLTFKKAGSSDIWFHTKDIPGSHVILFTDGQSPSEEELFQTAAIAAYHSKASTSENVPVDYVKVKYVKKPSGSKPGYVIFTHNKTLYVNPSIPE